jgi:hypothetical protein
VTITLPGLLLVSAAFFLVCIVYGGITVWRRRIPGAPLGTTIRVGVYLSRYAMALEYYGLRKSEIRAHIESCAAISARWPTSTARCSGSGPLAPWQQQ